MNSFFEDKYINSKILSRLTREIKRDELDRTIFELECLNAIQSRVLSRSDFTSEQNEELEFIKKLNNARRKNLQA